MWRPFLMQKSPSKGKRRARVTKWSKLSGYNIHADFVIVAIFQLVNCVSVKAVL